MFKLISDSRWVFKIIESCKTKDQLDVAKNCLNQLQVKWSYLIDDYDEKTKKIYDECVIQLTEHIKKFELKYGK